MFDVVFEQPYIFIYIKILTNYIKSDRNANSKF